MRRRSTSRRTSGSRRGELSRFLRSAGFAVEGIVATARREPNFRIHGVAAALVVGAGALLGIERWQWVAIVGCIAGVMALELVNTAIESVVDLASPGHHALAKRAKDAAAGGVLVGALGAAAIGVLVFGPRLVALVGSG